MGVNIERSMNGELVEGASDGTVKKPRPNTSNITKDASGPARRALFNGTGGYGMVDTNDYADDVVSGVVRDT